MTGRSIFQTIVVALSRASGYTERATPIHRLERGRAISQAQAFTIRPFEPTGAEYEAVVALNQAVWPDSPETVATMQHEDATRDPEYLFQRLVVLLGPEIVALASYGETPWSYRPGKYQIHIEVHPDHGRQGIGSALYEHVLGALGRQEQKPELLVSGTREDQPQAIRFLEQRGFRQVMRWIVSELDLESFDPSAFAGLLARVEAGGVRVLALTELMESDPEWQRKLWDLDWELTLDEPLPSPPTRLPLEQFVKQFLDGPAFLPEAEFIALEGERFIGLSGLEKDLASRERLRTGFTGVARGYRRRGIATALKLRAIAYARDAGIRSIRTGNEEHNPMYGINVALGFKMVTAYRAYEKEIPASGSG